MSDLSDLPEPDRVEGAPHPRETTRLIGQDAAEAAFLQAYNSDRLHHGWLLTGPRGVGKATLAWRIAQFLLATPPADDGGLFGAPPAPDTLDISADHPVAHRLAVLSEPGLCLIRRGPNDKGDAISNDIRVDQVRKLKSFFGLSASDGGRRVVIVDAADELNISAANALLKELEEPPARTTMLLISHQPSRLLPTIRSRCRELRLGTMSADQIAQAMAAAGAETNNPQALAELSGGSVGEAIRLTNLGGLELYTELISLLDSLPGLDRPRALKLAGSTTGKAAKPRYDLLLALLDLFMARLSRSGVAGPPRIEAAPGEASLMARLCPDSYAARIWAETAQDLGARARHARAVNLDPSSLILDTVLRIDQMAATLAARQAQI